MSLLHTHTSLGIGGGYLTVPTAGGTSVSGPEKIQIIVALYRDDEVQRYNDYKNFIDSKLLNQPKDAVFYKNYMLF